MKLNSSTSATNTKNPIGVGNSDASRPLIKLVKKELDSITDIYNNLSTKYDDLACDKLEKRFIGTRKMFKSTLMDLSNQHQPYVIRSEKRKESVNKIIKSSTEVAEVFQEARENKRFDRPKCTNVMENLIFDLKNFKHIIEEQGK